MESECGQSNPFLQLDNHVTSDRAHQERIGQLSAYGNTQGNPMSPQTFRMDELMQELQADKSPMLPSTPNRLPTDSVVDEYNSQLNSLVFYSEFFHPQGTILQCHSFDRPQFCAHHENMQKIKSERKENLKEEPKEDGSEFWAHLENIQKVKNERKEKPKEDSSENVLMKKMAEVGDHLENVQKIKSQRKEKPTEEEPKEDSSEEDVLMKKMAEVGDHLENVQKIKSQRKEKPTEEEPTEDVLMKKMTEVWDHLENVQTIKSQRKEKPTEEEPKEDSPEEDVLMKKMTEVRDHLENVQTIKSQRKEKPTKEEPKEDSSEKDGSKFSAHLENIQKIKSQRKEKPKEAEPKKDSSEEEGSSDDNSSEEEGSSEEEDSSEDATSAAKSLICWEGFSVQDELGVTNFPLSQPRLYYEFDKAYRYNHYYLENPNKIKNIHSIDSEFKLQKLISNTPYKYSKDNPMFKLSDAYKEGVNAMEDNAIIKAILCFEAAVQKDPHNIDKLFKLCEALLRNHEPRSALSVANQILELAPNHPIPHYCKVMIYNNQKCDYQTCQSVFNWLMCHNSYRDIIPPHFKIEDKTTTDLDEDTLNAVTKILIRAVQQNPSNLDLDVQSFLGILCTISGKYDNAINCLRLMLYYTNPKSRLANATKLKMSEYLFFANKPKQSLALLMKQTKTLEFEDYQRIGFIYIYLKEYKQAALYLTTGLNKKYASTIFDFEMYRKDAARLSLCLEFLCRQHCRGIAEDFKKNFPAFLKSYYKKHILVHNVVFPNPT